MSVRAGATILACALGAVSFAISDGRTLGPPDASATPVVVTQGGVVSPSPAMVRVTTTARPGYHLEAPVIGFVPTGFDVWVDHAAPHHVALASDAKRAVTALAGLGIPMRWRGYGKPAVKTGRIVITEKRSACVVGTSVAATTYWSALRLPSGRAYLTQSRIVACPTVFARQSGRARQAIVFHEMGHTVGLGHTNYRYDGRRQIMNATCDGSVDTYQRGDIAGLRRIVANEAIIRQALTRR